MKSNVARSLLDLFRRTNTSSVPPRGEVEQKKSGGYNSKRVRNGRSGDTSGNRHGHGK